MSRLCVWLLVSVIGSLMLRCIGVLVVCCG